MERRRDRETERQRDVEMGDSLCPAVSTSLRLPVSYSLNHASRATAGGGC